LRPATSLGLLPSGSLDDDGRSNSAAAALALQTDLENAGMVARTFTAAEDSGRLKFKKERNDPILHQTSATRALERLQRPRRGRPPGLTNAAGAKLMKRLAHIYSAHVGRPTRTVRRVGGQYQEVGEFHAFAELIISALPRALRRTKQGGYKSVNYIVRRAVESSTALEELLP
jgi:hypothetical protein